MLLLWQLLAMQSSSSKRRICEGSSSGWSAEFARVASDAVHSCLAPNCSHTFRFANRVNSQVQNLVAHLWYDLKLRSRIMLHSSRRAFLLQFPGSLVVVSSYYRITHSYSRNTQLEPLHMRLRNTVSDIYRLNLWRFPKFCQTSRPCGVAPINSLTLSPIWPWTYATVPLNWEILQ